MVFRDVRTVENKIKREFAEQYVVLDESEQNQTGDNQADRPSEIYAEDLDFNPLAQMKANTHDSNLRRSARETKEPDRYGKMMIPAANSCFIDDSQSY